MKTFCFLSYLICDKCQLSYMTGLGLYYMVINLTLIIGDAMRTIHIANGGAILPRGKSNER